MKYCVLLGVLVVAVAGQQLLSPEGLNELCSGNVDAQCRAKVRKCIQIRQTTKGISIDRQQILECARSNGVSRPLLLATILNAARGENGGPLDYLSVDQSVVEKLRSCVLDKAGLLDGSGNLDQGAINGKIRQAFTHNLTVKVREAMEGALDSCAFPTKLAETQQFRRCAYKACVQTIE